MTISSRLVRTMRVVGLVVVVQAALFVAFRWITERRRASEATFGVECLSPTAPWDFEMTLRDGSSKKLGTLRGAPVLVHFWATWCPPCRDELPQVIALSNRLNVVAVSLDSRDDELRRFFGEAVPSSVVRAEEGTARTLGVTTLPDTYLLDRSGVAYARFFGAREWRGRDPIALAVHCER